MYLNEIITREEEFRMNSSRKKGFTLIELLVVISIIALLLSILMPALTKVKEQARAVICRANLKQWGVVFMLYGDDNEESFPMSIADDYIRDREAYWMGATMPYYNDPDLRFCPSTQPDPEGPFGPGWPDLTPGAAPYGLTDQRWGDFGEGSEGDWFDQFAEGSYGLNEWCANPPQGVNDIWGAPPESTWRKFTRVDRATEVPMFLDARMVDAYPRADVDGTVNNPVATEDGPVSYLYAADSINIFNMNRHSKSVNAVFVDGSAGKIGLKQLWTMRWSRNFDTRNKWTLAGDVTAAQWDAAAPWMSSFPEF